MEYYLNILCCEVGWLVENGILSMSNYKQLKKRQQIETVRRGCKGTPALVAYESLPERFKEAIKESFGDPFVLIKRESFQEKIKTDAHAATYFSREFRLEDGRELEAKYQRLYINDAQILNLIQELLQNRKGRKKALGGKFTKKAFWNRISESVQTINTNSYPHTLPTSARRIEQKYRTYINDGYRSLVSSKFGNDNNRKVTVQIEKLILSLYTLPNKPYSKNVHELYMQFLGGAIDVADVETGELFNRDDFYRDGSPVTISEQTVWNYINDPANRSKVDKFRMGRLEYNSTHRPHHHRIQPHYALSKISMDDRDLPRKTKEGIRVKAYYAYDIASGCVIGSSYSKKKTLPLFIDCMRDMFRFLHKNGLGIPMEVEVENHLVDSFKDDLMKAGTVFPFVRWANPGNAQEKYAETLNRVKKYGFEKKYQEGIGRFYSKLEANRTRSEKIFDAENNNYKEKTYLYEDLVADDREVIARYNASLHPNQKKYKGMSRMQVLLHHLNPDLASYNESLLARYIGEGRKTSIRRSQYVVVNYSKYVLPSVEVLSRLKPNNYNVAAYWLPHQDDKVYLYQGDEYLCECAQINEYQTAEAEKTDKDREAYLEQAKYVSTFDASIKDNGKVVKVEVIENVPSLSEEVSVEIVKPVSADDDESFDFENQSYEDLKERAREDL